MAICTTTSTIGVVLVSNPMRYSFHSSYFHSGGVRLVSFSPFRLVLSCSKSRLRMFAVGSMHIVGGDWGKPSFKIPVQTLSPLKNAIQRPYLHSSHPVFAFSSKRLPSAAPFCGFPVSAIVKAFSTCESTAPFALSLSLEDRC